MAHPDGCFPPPTRPVPWFHPVKTKSISFSLRSLLLARSFGQAETGAPAPRWREEPILLLACRRQIVYNKSEACLTQLAEYRFCKPNVIGSTPIVGYLILPLLSAKISALNLVLRTMRPRLRPVQTKEIDRSLPPPGGRKEGGREEREEWRRGSTVDRETTSIHNRAREKEKGL
jgi:hypothetical protein